MELRTISVCTGAGNNLYKKSRHIVSAFFVQFIIGDPLSFFGDMGYTYCNVRENGSNGKCFGKTLGRQLLHIAW